MSRRLGLRLYAMIEGALKQFASFEFELVITFQCFLTIFVIDGRLGWYWMTRGSLSLDFFSTLTSACSLVMFLILANPFSPEHLEQIESHHKSIKTVPEKGVRSCEHFLQPLLPLEGDMPVL